MNSGEIPVWLLAMAKKLRGESNDALNVEKVLAEHKIQLRFETCEKRSGTLGQAKDNRWFVIVRGKRPTIDRFTMAHELGHYFLITHFNYSPTIADKKNYFFCEQICNQFAAHLLIDYDNVATLKIDSAKECLRQVRDIRSRYAVSLEASARAIIETHLGMGICAFMKSGHDQQKRIWGLSSLKGISPRYPHKRLKYASLKEEMAKWGGEIFGKDLPDDGIDFATESLDTSTSSAKLKYSFSELKTELSAILLMKPPAD